MTKEIRIPETRTSGSKTLDSHSAFGFRHSFGLRHLDFVIIHAAPAHEPRSSRRKEAHYFRHNSRSLRTSAASVQRAPRRHWERGIYSARAVGGLKSALRLGWCQEAHFIPNS